MAWIALRDFRERGQSALVTLDVTSGNINPIPIAIPNFLGADSGLGANIAAVITNDLKRSGLFLPVDPSAFPPAQNSAGVTPSFAGWQPTSGALVGRVLLGADGKMTVGELIAAYPPLAVLPMIGLRAPAALIGCPSNITRAICSSRIAARI